MSAVGPSGAKVSRLGFELREDHSNFKTRPWSKSLSSNSTFTADFVAYNLRLMYLFIAEVNPTYIFPQQIRY